MSVLWHVCLLLFGYQLKAHLNLLKCLGHKLALGFNCSLVMLVCYAASHAIFRGVIAGFGCTLDVVSHARLLEKEEQYINE